MKFYLFYLIIALIVGMTSYIVTDNVIYCVVAVSIFVIYFVLFDLTIKKKQIIKKRKKDDLSIFLHDFISVYYIEPNIDKSLEYALSQVSDELKEELKMLEEYKSLEKLNHLSNYFSNNLFELFLGTIKNKEGKKNELLEYVKKENDYTLKEVKEFDKEIKKTIFEYLILWLASSLILVAMRFAIHNYFNKISKNIFFLIGVSMFYLVFILSVHLLIRGCIKKYE